MRKTIEDLLTSGYRFCGLDEHGNKKEQICNGVNAPKICIFLGNPHGCDVLELFSNGRNFLKKHLPSLVDERDEEWQDQMTEATTQGE